MAESGNRPAVRISQNRLTIVVAVLGLLGCLLLGLLWWNSLEKFCGYSAKNNAIIICNSAVHYAPQQSFHTEGFIWGSLSGIYALGDWQNSEIPALNIKEAFFIRPVFSHSYIRIPIYLLILTYLASLLLIWIVLMNRLARHGSLWRRGLHPLSGGSGNPSSNERA